MKDLLLLSICSFALTGTAAAQNWVQSIEEEVDVLATVVRENNEIVVLGNDHDSGHSKLEIFMPTGNAKAAMLFESSPGSGIYARGMTLAEDGSLLVCGRHGVHAWLAALDLDTAEVLWETTTVSAPNIAELDVVASGPSAVFAAGHVEQPGADNDGYLASYDPDGALLWQRRIGPFDESSGVVDLIATSDGGALVALSVAFSGGGNLFLIRFDSGGNVQWASDPNPAAFGATSLVGLDDGSFLIARGIYDGSQNLWLAQMDSAGTTLWQRFYPSVEPLGMTRASDGDIALTTSISGYTGLLRLGGDGSVKSHKRLIASVVPWEHDCDIAPNPDGSVVVAWSILDPDPMNYVGRFDAASFAGPGCGSAIFEVGASSQVSNYSSSTVTVDTNVWFGSASIAPVTLVPDTLSVDLACGNPCAPISYCEKSPNSVGPGARIDYSGTTSVFANNLTLSANGIAPNKPGIFFYGSATQHRPLNAGIICVGGSIQRLPVQFSSPTGTMSYSLDLTDPLASAITAESTWYFQCWYRDPLGSNFSDALTTNWCP